LEDPGIDGRIILRWIFRKWVHVSAVMNLMGSTKCGEFLDWL
jgi:hypothetical protein